MSTERTYSDVEQERDDVISALFNERAAIIMQYRIKHGTDKPCSDRSWAAYLEDISPDQERIDFISARIKKAYKKYDRKLFGLKNTKIRF